jgi:hypothetical protein
MKSKMVATAGLSLTLNPMGKMFQNANLIEAWMFIGWSSTKFRFFCSDIKFKMAAMAEHSLTLDLMGKCFKTLLCWNHLDNWNQTFQECHLMGLYKFSFFLCWLEIQASHHLKIYGRPSWKSILRRSFTNFVYFMLIGIPRWLPLQDIVFT